MQCSTLLDAIELSIIIIRQIYPQSLPKMLLNQQIFYPCPALIFPKNVLLNSILAQPTRKRLSSSRNSTTLPPLSLSTVNFAIHRSTTHATHRFAQRFCSQQSNCLRMPLTSLHLIVTSLHFYILVLAG